jgi:uncharacterized protein (TIRG00374 family)
MDKEKAKTIVKSLLKFLIAFLIIFWMVKKGMLDFKLLGQLLTFKHLSICLGLCFVPIFLNNLRWLILMRSQGLEVTVPRTLSLSFIGLFFNFVIPGGVGGDIIKGYYLFKDQEKSRMVAGMSILVDRIVGVAGFSLISLVAIVTRPDLLESQPQLQSVTLAVLGLFTGIFLFFLISASDKFSQHPLLKSLFDRIPLGKFFDSMLTTVQAFSRKPKHLLVSIGLTFFSQLTMILMMFYAGTALGFEIPFTVYAFAIPIALIVTAVPIAPAGLGVGQAAIFVLFSWATGSDTQAGTSAITAFQACMLGWGFLGLFLYLRQK